MHESKNLNQSISPCKRTCLSSTAYSRTRIGLLFQTRHQSEHFSGRMTMQIPGSFARNIDHERVVVHGSFHQRCY